MSHMLKYQIDYFYNVILLGSNERRDSFFKETKLELNDYLKVSIHKHKNKMVSKIWSVDEKVTNENRYFESDVNLTIILIDLKEDVEKVKNFFDQRKIIARLSKLVVIGICDDDTKPKYRKNIVKLATLCKNNGIDYYHNNTNYLDVITTYVETERLKRKHIINLQYKKDLEAKCH